MKQQLSAYPSRHKSLNELKELGELKRFRSDLDYFKRLMHAKNAMQLRTNALVQFMAKYHADLAFQMYCKSNAIPAGIFALVYDIPSSGCLGELISQLTLDELVDQALAFISVLENNSANAVELVVNLIVVPHEKKSSVSTLKQLLIPWFLSIQPVFIQSTFNCQSVKFLQFFSDERSLLPTVIQLFKFEETLVKEPFFLELLLNITGEAECCNQLYLRYPQQFEFVFKSMVQCVDFVGVAILINLVEFTDEFRNTLLFNYKPDLMELAKRINDDSDTQLDCSIIALFLCAFSLRDEKFNPATEFAVEAKCLLEFIKLFANYNLASGNNKLLWNKSFKKVIDKLHS